MNLIKAENSFIKDFRMVKSLGFIQSHRKHNTGIGKTFEDIIGIKENNNQAADYQSIIEIKSQRELSKSYITLFTQAPTSPKNANTFLRENYGYPDKNHPELKVLHTSFFYNKFNNLKNKYGFKMEIKNDLIYIRILNKETENIIENDISYNLETIKSKIEKKCLLIAFVTAATKLEKNIELFHFTNCVLLSEFSFEKFLEAIKQDDIMYDIRIGCYKSGNNKGKTHDHGSGFRIQKKNLNKYFKIEDL